MEGRTKGLTPNAHCANYGFQMPTTMKGEEMFNGARLKKERGKLSKRFCAKQVGVSRRTWGRWERGECAPRPVHLERIAFLFGIRSYLLYKDSNPVGPGELGAPVEEKYN